MSAPSSKQPAPRSQFIQKLHALLENPYDGDSLRWISHDAFEISSNDARARNALSPSWDFRSLSSFIRQLSYYGFKRLSDRRRSSERRSAAANYIIFSHPSGVFLQGDNSRLSTIARKTRNRPEKRGSIANGGARRGSDASNASYDEQSSPPQSAGFMTQSSHWTSSATHDDLFADDRRQSLPSFPGGYQATAYDQVHRGPSMHGRSSDVTAWKAYTPSGWESQRLGVSSTSLNGQRRLSIADFKLSTTPEPYGQPIAFTQTSPSSSFLDSRPRLRKAASSLCIQTTGPGGSTPGPPMRSPSAHLPPYPTPTFSPNGHTYFSLGHQQQQVSEQQAQQHHDRHQQQQQHHHHHQPQQQQQQPTMREAYQIPPGAQHEPSQSYTVASLPSPTNSHSPDNSPRQPEFNFDASKGPSQQAQSASSLNPTGGAGQSRQILNPQQVSPQFQSGFERGPNHEASNGSHRHQTASAYFSDSHNHESWSQPLPVRAAY